MCLLSSLIPPSSCQRWRPLLLLALLVGGCGRNDIQVYSVPKEKSSLEPWKLPSGWAQQPADTMRAARFSVPGTNGAAEVSIIPMKVTASRADLLNVWREQLRLAPVTESALERLTEKVPVGSAQGELYDMVSEGQLNEEKSKSRILVASVTGEGATWIVKMTGPDEVVGKEKAAFRSFLQSLNFEALNAQPESSHQMASTNAKRVPQTAPSADEKPQWTIPPGWKEQPPPQML